MILRPRPSPNQAPRPPDLPIDMLVLHYTGMVSAEAALDRLCDPVAQVSAHYVVEEDGGVWSLVEEDARAQHAGVSFWRGHSGLNDRSIGIEIVNPGHAHGYPDFPAAQMAAVCALCLDILGRHPIPARNVVAHSDVAPGRKDDPGEKFNWFGMARNGVGLWPVDTPDVGTNPMRDIDEIRTGLRWVGYDVAPIGPADAALSSVLRAFQRHWRPEAVTGDADQGTLARLAALLRLCELDAV